ncbi:MAG: septal ring lytic transglycosylase RlpA family protein [Oscillatoriales cyanobacterium C42_A2020_001]|nr:septal ring lytic transglycosylase RlpA family protein [Leptolyngbyaceae cyanobacterium C42_A2020_001]
MNHKLLSSLTASLLIATLGVPLSSNAIPPEQTSQDSEPTTNRASSEPDASAEAGSSDAIAQTGSSGSTVAKLGKQSNEVVKVGDQQSQTAPQASTTIVAKVQPHTVSGREAATLYVRNIPILTFLGSNRATPDGVKLGTQIQSTSEETSSTKAKSLDKVSSSGGSLTSVLRSSFTLSEPSLDSFKLEALDDASAKANPVWRATVIAARINQLHRDGIGAESITVGWDNQQKEATSGDRFVIKTNRVAIALIDSNTILPDTTRNPEQDALQATNRLRRVLGNAAPLREIDGQPGARGGQEFSMGPIRMRLTGFASWYGPGFHGNQSASGERFNQHAMTAAHRTLPFGTRVLVTNLDNGQSVVVRINDRGPFHGNRVIDLSTAAARVLGLIQSGVAPVRLDVIDSRSASAAGN